MSCCSSWEIAMQFKNEKCFISHDLNLKWLGIWAKYFPSDSWNFPSCPISFSWCRRAIWGMSLLFPHALCPAPTPSTSFLFLPRWKTILSHSDWLPCHRCGYLPESWRQPNPTDGQARFKMVERWTNKLKEEKRGGGGDTCLEGDWESRRSRL